MISVKAIYDGKNIKLMEKIERKKPGNVIVTFLDEEDTDITMKFFTLLRKAGYSIS